MALTLLRLEPVFGRCDRGKDGMQQQIQRETWICLGIIYRIELN